MKATQKQDVWTAWYQVSDAICVPNFNEVLMIIIKAPTEIFWHQTHKLELSGWTWQISKQNRRPNVTSCPQALIYPAIHIIMHAHTNLISILSWAPRILLYVQIEKQSCFLPTQLCPIPSWISLQSTPESYYLYSISNQALCNICYYARLTTLVTWIGTSLGQVFYHLQPKYKIYEAIKT